METWKYENMKIILFHECRCRFMHFNSCLNSAISCFPFTWLFYLSFLSASEHFASVNRNDAKNNIKVVDPLMPCIAP